MRNYLSNRLESASWEPNPAARRPLRAGGAGGARRPPPGSHPLDRLCVVGHPLVGDLGHVVRVRVPEGVRGRRESWRHGDGGGTRPPGSESGSSASLTAVTVPTPVATARSGAPGPASRRTPAPAGAGASSGHGGRRGHRGPRPAADAVLVGLASSGGARRAVRIATQAGAERRVGRGSRVGVRGRTTTRVAVSSLAWPACGASARCPGPRLPYRCVPGQGLRSDARPCPSADPDGHRQALRLIRGNSRKGDWEHLDQSRVRAKGGRALPAPALAPRVRALPLLLRPRALPARQQSRLGPDQRS